MTTLDEVNDWRAKGTLDPEVRAGIVAMLDRLGELCDSHSECESCNCVLCEDCEIGTESRCPHHDICQDCYDLPFCHTCAYDDYRWDQGDQLRANQKEGN